MTIEKMTLGDVPIVLKFGTNVDAFEVTERDCFWSQQQLEAWVKADEDVLLVAKDGNEIVGFALSTLHRPTGKVTWENLYVLPQYRSQGVGRKLIEELFVQLKHRGTTYMCFLVRSENSGEVSYFEHRGFDRGRNFVWFGKHL